MNDDPPTREVTLCTSRPGSRADAVQEEGGWTPTAGMARSPCGADDASRREPGRDRRWGLGRGHRPSVPPFPGRAELLMAVEMFSLTGAPLCSAYELESIPEAHRRTERDADENGMGRLHICSAVTLDRRAGARPTP